MATNVKSAPINIKTVRKKLKERPVVFSNCPVEAGELKQKKERRGKERQSGGNRWSSKSPRWVKDATTSQPNVARQSMVFPFSLPEKQGQWGLDRHSNNDNGNADADAGVAASVDARRRLI